MQRDDNYSNPFDDSADVNPFAEAARQRSPPSIPATVAPTAQRNDFNPFADSTAKQAPAPAPTFQPAPVISSVPVATGPSSRELELERKLAEMEAKQKRLEATGVLEKPKNWPICYPLVRHNISEDVHDPAVARLVKFGFVAFLLHACALLVNMVAALAILVSPTDPPGTLDASAGSNFGISIVFLVLGVPLSWVFWYRPFYNAAAEDKAAKYLIFLCMFALNICFVAILIIGIEGAGTCGFIEMIHTFSLGKTVAGIICIIGIAGLGAELGLDIFLIIRVYLQFRGRGGTDAVKKEAMGSAAQAAAENPQIVAGVARGAISASNAV